MAILSVSVQVPNYSEPLFLFFLNVLFRYLISFFSVKSRLITLTHWLHCFRLFFFNRRSSSSSSFLTHMLLKSSRYVSSPLPSDIRLSSLSISLASTCTQQMDSDLKMGRHGAARSEIRGGYSANHIISKLLS